MAVSYAGDIRPLFRPMDISSMKNFGGFDLSSYDDVRANADAIVRKLKAGAMPCDGAWPPDQVELFERWMADGMQP